MFNTMTLSEMSQDGWYMDAVVTCHVHVNMGILKFVLDNSTFSSFILVGDVSFICVTEMGHSILPYSNMFRTLHLKNLLITPSIITILSMFFVLFVKIIIRLNLTLLVVL